MIPINCSSSFPKMQKKRDSVISLFSPDTSERREHLLGYQALEIYEEQVTHEEELINTLKSSHHRSPFPTSK